MSVLQIARNGEHIGTIEAGELAQHLAGGTIFPSDHFYYEEAGEWRVVAELVPPPAKPLELAVIPPAPAAPERAHLWREPGLQKSTLDPHEILWVGHPHKTLIGKVILSCVYAITILGIFAVPLIWIRNTRYCVTRSRLMIERGILRKNSSEVRIADLRNISLINKSLLFGTATLLFDVSGSQGAEIVFRDILAAERVRDLVRSLQG